MLSTISYMFRSLSFFLFVKFHFSARCPCLTISGLVCVVLLFRLPKLQVVAGVAGFALFRANVWI